MHKFYSYVIIDGKLCVAKMAVDESYAPGQNDTNKKFYYVRAIKIEPLSSVGIGFNHTPIMDEKDSNISISELFAIVKSLDKKFKPKDVNPAMLNEDGTPKVVYHGTRNKFTMFHKWSYFTEDKKYAEGYASEAYGKSRGEVKECYIDVKKTFDIRDKNTLKIY